MQDILKKKQHSSPDKGDMWLKPGADEIIMWSGTEWVTGKHPFNETSDAFYRQKFNEESEEFHKEHPELKELWEEYQIRRKLKTGS